MKHPTLHVEAARAERKEREGWLQRGGGSEDEDRLETAKSDATSEVW